jgi:hypothetical protein
MNVYRTSIVDVFSLLNDAIVATGSVNSYTAFHSEHRSGTERANFQAVPHLRHELDRGTWRQPLKVS